MTGACERDVVIDAAGAGDIGLLTALHRRCFERAWTVADFARLMAVPGALALVARRAPDASVCGFLLARLAAAEAEILTLGVLPASRRNGIGRALVLTAAERLVATGAESLFIEVAITNDAARALYAALGFVEVGRRPDYYNLGDGRREDALVMQLALESPA